MKTTHLLLLILFSVLIIILIVLSSICFITNLYDKPQDWGAIGDMFGAPNAIFSGLAFLGIIITLVFQSKELRLQSTEIKNAISVFEKQKFDSIFFNMLGFLKSKIDSISYKPRNGYELNGIGAIRKVYKEYFLAIIDNKGQGYTEPRIEFKSKLRNGVNATGDIFHEYINTIKLILEFIDENINLSSPDDSKISPFYRNIIFGLLSDIEKLIIFHFAVFKGDERFLMLCKKYKIFFGVKNAELFLSVDGEIVYRDSELDHVGYYEDNCR